MKKPIPIATVKTKAAMPSRSVCSRNLMPDMTKKNNAATTRPSASCGTPGSSIPKKKTSIGIQPMVATARKIDTAPSRRATKLMRLRVSRARCVRELTKTDGIRTIVWRELMCPLIERPALLTVRRAHTIAHATGDRPRAICAQPSPKIGFITVPPCAANGGAPRQCAQRCGH
ncbi:MAG TPA: hypothetical protein VNR11_07405 [Xanthobacteraceae bacterium]|nr:hypothetical protein [Xanthobacteraceae bacterium]